MVLEKTLESPLDCKEIHPVHSKGDQSWVFIGRTDVEAETPVLWSQEAETVSDITFRAPVEPAMLVGSVLGICLLTYSLLCVVEASCFSWRLAVCTHRKETSVTEFHQNVSLCTE